MSFFRAARPWARVGIVVLCFCGTVVSPPPARAETVALWLFDEPVGTPLNSLLKDAGPRHHDLVPGGGGEITRGKFGNALRPVGERREDASSTSRNRDVAAAPLGEQPRSAGAPSANPSDSKLNLGADDWTLECWLRLEEGAASDGTIFEIGTGPRGENALCTRFTVLPGENAFALSGIARVAAPGAVALGVIEFANADGPPGGRGFPQTHTLSLRGRRLPRGTWFHVALVHVAATRGLHLYLDGQAAAVATALVDALPHGDQAYISIGRDGRWQRALVGAIDELRISDTAVYSGAFSTPDTFAGLGKGAHPRVR